VILSFVPREGASPKDVEACRVLNATMQMPFDPLTGDNLRWLLSAFWVMVDLQRQALTRLLYGR
jgi:hypothetical protein